MFQITKNQPLVSLNTLAIAANAEFFSQVSSREELQEAIAYGQQHQLAITVLGGGSNIVLTKDIAGLVIHIAIPGIELKAASLNDSSSKLDYERYISIGAGENWHQLVEHSLAKGWYGLENLALIPGLVGAAPIQNIGAYGVELNDVFESLQAVDLHTGEQVVMGKDDCQFGYRDSIFKHQYRNQFAICQIDLKLSSEPKLCLDYPALKTSLQKYDEVTPEQVAKTVSSIRRSKLPDPKYTPNAGSFFKNPVVSAAHVQKLRKQEPQLVSFTQPNGDEKLAAGWLIEACGWKGFRQGKTSVHEQQALVLVNKGGTGADILHLAKDISDSVKSRFGVTLEIEPRVY